MAFPMCNTTWQQNIAVHRIWASDHADIMFNTSKIKISVNQAIVYAGATGRVILPGSPLNNIQPETRPLVINFPYGETLQSTHTGNLDIVWIPKEATRSHIVPGLACTYLVSIKILCNAGWKVSYDKEKCLILYSNKLVWQVTREPLKILWILPLRPRTPPDNLPIQTSTANKK